MDLRQRDFEHIWHPFTLPSQARNNIVIERSEGASLFTADGRRIIDGISSWWSVLHGHSHPYISAKVKEQLDRMHHVLFAGMTHAPAVELAERILKILPKNQTKIFFSDNGSTACEVALKIAFQYWSNLGRERHSVICFEHGYHGDTFGAMAVGHPGVFTEPFRKLFFPVDRIPLPLSGEEERSLAALREVLRLKKPAAFIFEPLVLGAGGMTMYDPQPLSQMIGMCQREGVLTIADEVMTGFGRTGTTFAIDQLDHVPDMVALSKGLTGGTMPLAVTSCSDQIYQAFQSVEKSHAFFHGHTFGGNPLGCSAALASLDLFEKPACQENLQRIAESHKRAAAELERHGRAHNVRTKGMILALEFGAAVEGEYLSPLRDKLYDFFLKNDVLLRPLGNTVYVLPPYCMSDADLNTIYRVITAALDEVRIQ